MAANKKKLDEKHLKMLREMVALPHNKQCFDCHQRGPTYLNMTIGSYVCTACSGLLRGLNPPHRVKSISMASFTPEEMEFIKCHGNEYCRRVWLGLYDNSLGGQTEGRDESKVKDFMLQKYERKRYYVAPTESMKEEAVRMNESAISKTPGTKPLKSLLGENAPKLQVGNTLQRAAVSATPPPTTSTPQSPGSQSIQSSRSSGSTALDLLGDLGGDPFVSSSQQAHPPSGGGFADFGSFGGASQSSKPAPFPQAAPLQLASSTAKTTQQSFNGFTSIPATSGGGGDKYSNLSDLFSVENKEESTTSWSSSLSTSTGVNWNSTSVSSTTGGVNWGGGSTSLGSGGANWNSSSSQLTPSSAGLNWGGTSAANTSTSWGGTSASAQTNVSNPFGGSLNTNMVSQTSVGTVSVNPFGGQPAASAGGFGAFGAQNTAVSQGGFGQIAGTTSTGTGASFGQFGTPSSRVGTGFGQFGTPISSAGFGSVQNGGFGATTSSAGPSGVQANIAPGFGGQPGFAGQPFGNIPGGGFGAQPGQQGFAQHNFGAPQVGAGWGQPGQTVNPFMSTAQQYSAPKTGTTNPFL